MRTLINVSVLFITFLIIFSCESISKGENSYSVQVNISGAKNGDVKLAKLDLFTNEMVIVDSCKMIHGAFSFSGNIESPYLHTIIFDQAPDKIHFFLENSDIKILGKNDDLEGIKVIGSREDSLFRTYSLDDIFDPRKGMEIMLNYPEYSYSALVAYYQFQYNNLSVDTMDHILDHFTEDIKESSYYYHLNELYQKINTTAIGRFAPDFTILDIENKAVSLKEFRGKYVFIDFWASWCAPCREENPILVRLNQLYQQRNLSIISISVDKKRNLWLDAVKKDHLSWTNLSNLQGWDLVTHEYGVKAVPQNFLIDPKGIILDKNIDIHSLSEKLNNILPQIE